MGANVGHYTKQCSELVKADERVIAFEPVFETFSLLSPNVQLFRFANLTLFNAALSNRSDLVGIFTPDSETGLKNFYEARITEGHPIKQ